MLKKLIKYNLKWQNKILLPLYGVSLLFAIIVRILMIIGENSLVINIIAQIMAGLTYSLLANILINTITRTIVKFVASIYKDEGYLTNTLPIDRRKIFLSKVLTSIINMVSSILVIVTCLFIILYTKENFEALKVLLELTASALNSSVIFIIIMAVLTIMIEFILLEQIGFLGIILGHKSNDRKGIKSLIWGLIIYFATQLVAVLSIIIIGLFDSSIMSALNSNTVSIDVIKSILIIADTLYLSLAIGYYLIASKQINKNFNIE